MHATIAIHHPRPEHRDAFLDFMRKVCANMEGTPGLQSFEMFTDPTQPRLVAVARWDSAQAFQAALPRLMSTGGRQPDWSAQPDELMQLDSAR